MNDLNAIVRRFAVCRPADTKGMSDADIRAAFGVELGICLSAEHSICRERAIGLGSNSAADQAAALGIEAVNLLRLVGIDYPTWVASRGSRPHVHAVAYAESVAPAEP